MLRTALLLAISASAATAQTVVDGSVIDPSVLKRVTQNFRDPVSAQFRNIRPGKKGVICGEVNAKNAMGGYVGFTRFGVSQANVVVLPPRRDAAYQIECIHLEIIGCGECR